MPRLSDTSPEADRVWTATYRGMSPAKKWAILGEDFRTGKLLHAGGCRHRRPGATAEDIHREWLALQYGFLGPVPGGSVMDPAVQNLQVVREVLAVLDNLGIPYALRGSMASSLHGIARHTRDADICVEPFPGKEAQLVAAFGPDYYVSLPTVEQAVRDRSSFNILNTREGFKVDLFVRPDEPFEQEAMRRRVPFIFPDRPGQPVSLLASEDIVLFKLRWYRLGGEVSDQQWSDVLGVLKVRAGQLDEAYLDRWAADLQVSDLLERARQEAR
jgi:hypothetical protein